jgi:hypothetical protein
MFPQHVYYLLVILRCLWLCVILHYGWPRPSIMPNPRTVEPVTLKFKRKSSTELKPFEGLTQRPHCAAQGHDLLIRIGSAERYC